MLHINKTWKDSQSLKRNSPFSQALAQNLSFNVEHHCLTSFINPVLGLQRVTFHYNLMPNVNKMSDHPELLKQLALELIAGIALDAAKIYTDGSDSTSRSILNLFQPLSDRHPIHLQWVPSNVGFLGNEVADDLAKAATGNHMVLTSTEIYSGAKELICRTWVVPPVHPWYFQRHPGSAISFKGSRSHQTAFSQFSTSHLRCMNFEGGKRSFPICPKCNINPFSPQHILQCLGFSYEEAVASLLLFLDFVQIYGLMDLV
ncbi:RNase H domain-containing protein [Trichonephila clavipes]|nr:RNase H domain-containing protein [Trichonephila clavipes]